ncbi:MULTISPECIES: cell division protein FtsQ/DivIB [Bacillaceae]|uniref:Cell division protein DivIB n=1 Tax=Peribacillus huizhouensis TaxID=1501239 RepID=A0ABR6CKA1_9BACI|nr:MULTISPECIES: cell division protein FtsQ/DivIB [Bacillaceae]MBA9024960.1 cell division protein FtsQ [Peribacillus huizhouensis]
MEKGKVVSIEDRIPKLKNLRKRKANRRLILLLSFFFILIACVLYFLSPLSHIKEIKVRGNQYLSSDQIVSLSGLTNDTNIWKVNKRELINKMKESQEEIESVTVTTQFPNSVLITITEFERIAYLSKNNRFYPIMENGKILTELKRGEIPVFAPVLIDFTEGDALNLLLDELKALPEEIRNSISEIRKEPTKTDLYHITMFMNDGFEVSATSRTLSKKMIHYPSIVAQLDPKVKGVINLEVGSYFRAYDTPNLKEENDEGLAQ